MPSGSNASISPYLAWMPQSVSICLLLCPLQYIHSACFPIPYLTIHTYTLRAPCYLPPLCLSAPISMDGHGCCRQDTTVAILFLLLLFFYFMHFTTLYQPPLSNNLVSPSYSVCLPYFHAILHVRTEPHLEAPSNSQM